MDTLQFEILLGVITILTSAGLGLMVYLRDRESWTNRFFAVLSFLICVYIVINYLSLHPPGGQGESQLFWVRMVMFVCSFIGPTLLGLAHTFPRARISFQARYFYAVLGLMVVSVTASLLPLVFKSIEYPNGEAVPVPGPGIPFFIFDFVGLFFLSFVVLGWRYRKAEGIERGQILQFLIGSLVSFSLMGIGTVIFVTFLKTSRFVFLGPSFSVVLMAFIAYAIVRYRLFNLKVFATQALVGVSWVVFFAKLFVPTTVEEKLIDALIFIFSVVMGGFLIRSVRREIAQKDELQALTTRLEAVNTKLTDLSRFKTELLSLASHQIKSPLAAIKGYLTLLKDGSFGVLPQTAAEAVGKVQHSADQLFELVNSLLDLRKVEEGKMDYQFVKIDIVPLVRGVVEELGQLASSKKLKLEFIASEPVILVSADAQKLRQVIQNLIDNSIKYTPAGSVKVALSRAGGKVVFVCADTGYGMTKDVVDQLFTEFMRDERLKKLIRGTGLGLYIAKKIVEAHGGTIRSESQGENLGSTFTVTLPALA